jgi:restriction endonuclease S subunit
MNSQTTWVKLREVCDTTSGGTPSRDVAAYYGGDIPWVKSGELLDGLITDTEEKITKAALASSSAKLFTAGTLLIALYGATVGRLGILGIDATTNQAVCGITPNEQLDRDFLFYYLLKQREKLIDSRTGGAQPNINQEIIRELDIPLPRLTEQKRIASLLKRVDRLRQLRRTAHDLGDALLQSVFLEMFGDPVKNPKNWDVKEIQEVVINHDSKRIPLEASVRNKRQGKYPYYGATGIIDYLDDYIFDKDMLLIAEDGKNLLNRTKPLAFMAYGKYWVNNHSHVVSSAGQINLKYLETALNTRDISSYVTGIDQFKLNRANLDIIPIQVPPLSLQEEFAGVVRRVEALRGRMGEAGRQVDGLFESLLAESFS